MHKGATFSGPIYFFLNFSRIKLSSSQIIDFGFDIFNTKSYNLTYQLRYENYEKREKQ